MKIGIIGYGNMGSAKAERIKFEHEIFVFDKDRDKTRDLSGIKVALDNVHLVKNVDAVILAVKPQDFEDVLREIKDYVKEKLVISIAAGITTAYIEHILGPVRVIRAMPNLAARIGKAITCLCGGKFSTKADLDFAVSLFGHLGKTLVVNEEHMDAVTAISGSGPGFVCYLMEAKAVDPYNMTAEFKNELEKKLAQLSEKFIQLKHDSALILASSVASGTVSLLRETKLSPQELRMRVTSKGGTTEAGLEVLDKGGTLEEAIRAAIARAKELSARPIIKGRKDV
jgi:pyrroline-5-carboxylate reductase